MMEEIWKDIEGYEGIYQVSNLGRVRSLDRYIIKPHPKNGVPTRYFQRGRVIVLYPCSNGYINIVLQAKGVYKHFMVHRLVAKAFVSGYFEGAEVNHKDFNRQNNRADNLEWLTHSDNQKYDNDVTASATERAHRDKRKPIIQMKMDGEFVREWPSIRSVHIALGHSKGNISGACHQRYGCKTCGGYRWRFKE